MTNDLIVLILAGGEGRRMGGGKPERLLGGVSLLDRALAIARQWTHQPLVAVRCGVERKLADARIIVDKAGIEGPLAGLASGVEEGLRQGANRLLLLPADMPFVPDDLLSRLSGALEQAGVGSGGAIAASEGRLHPVCSLWRLEALAPVLPSYCAAGHRSLRGLAQEVAAAQVEWPTIEGKDPFFNVNSLADLVAAEARLA